MYAIGLEIGASSVKTAAVEQNQDTGVRALAYSDMRAHKGEPRSCVRQMLAAVQLAMIGRRCCGVALTGSGAGVVRDVCPEVPVLEDIPALTLGAGLLAPEARSIVHMGGQQALFVTDLASGGAPRFSMNDSCAAGTGSFFEDQMQRLNMHIESYSEAVQRAESVPRLSGRCAVFAKTDIIHRQQEGVPTDDILLGLCYAMVKSYKSLIVGSLPVAKPVALSGGVLLNSGVVRAVREVFKLEEGELDAREGNLYFQAAGAALHLLAHEGGARAEAEGNAGKRARIAFVAPDRVSAALDAAPVADALASRDRLPRIDYVPGRGFRTKPAPWRVDATGTTPCALGIDIGSTSTNLVLVDEAGELLDAQYLRTRGNPKRAVARGLASIGERLGEKVRVVAVATTGSGRSLIGAFVGADVVRDEITAQARAAAAADAAVDTVFEIGGQDSKYVSLKRGQVADFQMNKVCAAGTGSFVEEQAARLGIPLSDYGEIALSSYRPVDLGERCTVFVETAINAALAKGASKPDVAAGLCQSIVRNYLHKVVGSKPVGDHIVLQGGVNYNQGIVAAFKQVFGDRITVSPWFAVSGAVGAALLALEASVDRTAFRGFDLSGAYAEPAAPRNEEIERNRAFFHKGDDLLLSGYTGDVDPAKKTVGVPRALLMYKFFPMALAFFTQLGFNVVITDMTNEETVRLAQETAQGETCFPVKLIHGHMAQLVKRGVDYIFMPSIHTIKHEKSDLAHNYGCPYMRTAPRLVAAELGCEERGITLLSPVFDLDFGQAAMASSMLDVGAQLGCDAHDTARALLAGSYAVQEFTRKTEQAGKELLDSLGPDDRAFVIVTRNYGIADAVLNAGIPDMLIDRGEKVISMSHLEAHSFGVAQDYPNLYWPFGQHILAATKLVRRDPRLFAVYLTNHGCGPDTMLQHLVAEEMGDKPYLQIEIDEHFSKVGIVTRLEAFLNSVDQYRAPQGEDLPLFTKTVVQNEAALEKDVPVAFPCIGVPGRAVGHALACAGYDVRPSAITRAAIEEGMARSRSKEYLSFSAQLGAAVSAAQHAESPVQVLVPSGEGADADGVFDRVIRSVLDGACERAPIVVAPRVERLPDFAGDKASLLFDALLAADVVHAAPPAVRAAVEDELLSGPLAFDRILAAARRVGSMGDDGASGAVLAVGEWPIVWDDLLSSGVLARLEAEGRRVKRMPTAEYFLFLWTDAYGEPGRFGAWRDRMDSVARALGDRSPFQGDFASLFGVADDLAGGFHSANARYRIAKAHEAGELAAGVIALSSMYENTDVILQLMESARSMPVPVLHLGLDGTLDASIEDKVNSFTYYLD